MKKYEVLIVIFGAEMIFVTILSKFNITIESRIGNVIGCFLLLLPIQLILYFLTKEETQHCKAKKIYKAIFWFINICYIGGTIGTLGR